MLTAEQMEEVYAYAGRLAGSWNLWGFGVDGEELRSIVNLIVTESLAKYDPAKARRVKPTAFVKWAVRRRLYDACYFEGSTFPTMRYVHDHKMVRTGVKRRRMPRTDPARIPRYDHATELIAWLESRLYTERHREIFRMRYVEERPLPEIGKRFGVSAEAVRQDIERNILPELRRAAECWY